MKAKLITKRQPLMFSLAMLSAAAGAHACVGGGGSSAGGSSGQARLTPCCKRPMQLDNLCYFGCEEFTELKTAVAQYEPAHRD